MAKVQAIVGIANYDEYQKVFEEVVLPKYAAKAESLLEQAVQYYEEGSTMNVDVDGELTKSKRSASFYFETDGAGEMYDIIEFYYVSYYE